MSNLQAKSLEDIYKHLLQCVTTMRSQVIQITESVTSEDATKIPSSAQLASWFKKVEALYGKMETIALQLPKKSESVDSIQKLTMEYTEEFRDPTQIVRGTNPIFPPGEEPPAGKDKIEIFADSLKYLDVYQHFMHFGEALSKFSLQRRRPTVLDIRPLTFTSYAHQPSPHKHFMNYLMQMKNDAAKKNYGISVEVIEEATNSSVIEVKSFQIFEQREQVVTQKTLIVEVDGSVEMVVFIAPHEEWKYLDEGGEFGKRIDILHRSRYLVYQKLTSACNTSFLGYLKYNPLEGKDSAIRMMMQIFHFIMRYHKVFETPCARCKKVMKDFLPPTLFDPRPKSDSMHESCRG